MTWQERAARGMEVASDHGRVAVADVPDIDIDDEERAMIERRVLDRLGGRLRSFAIDEIKGWLVLQGEASSYHAKQLAQEEVMELTHTPILANRIAVHD